MKGNITSKSDAGTYTYGNSNSKPYAVAEVNQSGSAVPARAQNVTYTSFWRPATISENYYVASFTYNGEGDRVRMRMRHNGSASYTRYYLGNCYEIDSTSTVRERLYLGGDYYTAPAVLVKTSSGANIYYILRDHLGSITRIYKSDNTLLQERSYDAWGRMRNPSTQAVYAPGNEPSLYLGRGYTGHEYLKEFGLVNMNARLYDPALGRFLSPDPVVQDSEDSQNYNRYSYCMNNPLSYVDTNGEIAWFIPVFGALIGGVTNLFANKKSIDGFWQGAAAFCVGAGAVASTVLTGGAGASVWAVGGVAAAGGAVTGATNNVIAQTGHNFEGFNRINWNEVGISATVGGVAGFAGGAAGYGAANMDFLVNNVSSPVLRSAVVSPLAAGAGHVAGGTTANLFKGQSLDKAFNNSFSGIGTSMAIGGAIGVASTIGVSYASGINPWNGKALNGITLTAKDLHIENEVQRIKDGIKYNQYPHDSSTFHNNPLKEGYLPQGIQYKEYVVPTHGIQGPGLQRIVIGSDGAWYYTPDHYKTYIRFKP